LTEEITHGQVEEDYIPDIEGKKRIIKHIAYERSLKNRAKAIEIHGTKCIVCGFDFNKFFGKKLARDYIEIHHIKSITEKEIPINPETDLYIAS
jgi:5-methylcytosine-specific restriction protein A